MTKTHITFDDIEDRELRAWNRASMGFNIGADEGKDAMVRYFSQFSNEDKMDVNDIFKQVRSDGYNQVRARISRSVQSRAEVPTFEENEANATLH